MFLSFYTPNGAEQNNNYRGISDDGKRSSNMCEQHETIASF